MPVKRFDPRMIIVAIIAVGLVYWLMLPRAWSNRSISQVQENNDHQKTTKSVITKAITEEQQVQVKESVIKINELRKAKLDFEGAKIDIEKAQNEINNLKNRLTLKDTEIEGYVKKHEETVKELENAKITVSESKKDGVKLTKDGQELKFKRFAGHKLVHLDLKGAAPKMVYLLELLKLFKELGATGLLVEYEDTYPYKGKLNVLQAKYAYSETEIRTFINQAKVLELIIVPLVPTFGHIEFVLKHKEFAHIRENKEMTNALCPLHKDSLPLMKKLITDILHLHPDCKWIHLGGDEVWNLKSCSKCKANKMSPADLFLYHMKPLMKYVKDESGGQVTPIIWDDMMREWEVKDLSEIAKLVQPMIWAYVPDLENYPGISDDMFKRYSKAFDKIWVASSFKGADRTTTNFVPIKDRVANHVSWLKIMFKLPPSLQVTGMALTGWSRFDHYGALCEILPASIPSLALCLGVLYEGQLNGILHNKISSQLGLNRPFQIDVTNFKRYEPENFTFPGHEVHQLVGQLEKSLGWYNWAKVRYSGWARPYQMQNYYLSFFHLNATLQGAEVCLNSLKDLLPKAKDILQPYFNDDTVNEWIADKIESGIENAKSLKTETQKCLKDGKFH